MPTKKKRQPKSHPTPIVPPEISATIGDLEPIQLRGIRVHNLKNLNVDIPRGKLVAICGVSGSGKTSLALDTLYAEGQRRYIESFSPYTRQFLQRLDKPDYDSINHLPPALAVTRSGGPARQSQHRWNCQRNARLPTHSVLKDCGPALHSVRAIGYFARSASGC